MLYMFESWCCAYSHIYSPSYLYNPLSVAIHINPFLSFSRLFMLFASRPCCLPTSKIDRLVPVFCTSGTAFTTKGCRNNPVLKCSGFDGKLFKLKGTEGRLSKLTCVSTGGWSKGLKPAVS